MSLKALSRVPPLGSFKDRYLRMVQGRERQIEYLKLALEVVNNRQKVSDEGAVADSKNAIDTFKQISNLYYPGSQEEQKTSDQRAMSAMENFLKKMQQTDLLADDSEGLPQQERRAPAPPERKPLWDSLADQQDER